MAYFHCLIGGGSSGGGYTLTVTCSADFAGTSITCTDGVTTLTQTCPSASPYVVEFEIPNGGDWTISGISSGHTTTTGVSIPTSAELIAMAHQTITIYSAKEDTITYTDVYGDTQTEVFASGQTSKQITVDIETSGSSITFSSGIAKEPTNLSNAYSKTVTIDTNTTEVYLMPDNALYWWGYESSNLENCTSANGWSGSYAYIAPTHNTNNISFSTSSNQLCGIGTKNTVSASKFYGIAKTTSGSNAHVIASSASPVSKSTSSNTDYDQPFTSTLSCQGVSNTKSPTYCSVRFAVGAVGTCNAFWYE